MARNIGILTSLYQQYIARFGNAAAVERMAANYKLSPAAEKIIVTSSDHRVLEALARNPFELDASTEYQLAHIDDSHVVRGLMSRPNLDAHTWIALAYNRAAYSPMSGEDICEHIDDYETLRHLATCENPYMRETLAGRKKELPSNIQTILAESKNVNVCLNLLRRKDLSENAELAIVKGYENGYNDEGERLITRLSGYSNLSAETQKYILSADCDRKLRNSFLTYNPYIDSSVLSLAMQSSGDEDMFKSLATNRNISDDVRMLLVNSDYETARLELLRSSQGLQTPLSSEVIGALLPYMTAHNKDEMQYHLAAQPNLKPEHQVYIYDEASDNALARLSDRKDLTPEIAEVLAYHDNPRISVETVRNNRQILSYSTLRKLADGMSGLSTDISRFAQEELSHRKTALRTLPANQKFEILNAPDIQDDIRQTLLRDPDTAIADAAKAYFVSRGVNGYVPEPVDVSDVRLAQRDNEFARRFAQAMHEDWYATRMSETPVRPSPLLKHWDALTDEQKRPFVEQAEATMKTFRKLGYAFAGKYDNSDDVSFVSNQEIIDALAKNSHEVWAVGKLEKGMTDHKDLIPYESLDDATKAYDVNIVKAMLSLAVKEGMYVYREPYVAEKVTEEEELKETESMRTEPVVSDSEETVKEKPAESRQEVYENQVPVSTGKSFMDIFFSPTERMELVGQEFGPAFIKGMETLCNNGRIEPHIIPQDMKGRSFSPESMTLLNIKMMNHRDWQPVFLTAKDLSDMGLKVYEGAERTSIIRREAGNSVIRDVVYNIADTNYPELHPEEYSAMKFILAEALRKDVNAYYFSDKRTGPSAYQNLSSVILSDIMDNDINESIRKADLGNAIKYLFTVNYEVCGSKYKVNVPRSAMSYELEKFKSAFSDNPTLAYEFSRSLDSFARKAADSYGIRFDRHGLNIEKAITEYLRQKNEIRLANSENMTQSQHSGLRK